MKRKYTIEVRSTYGLKPYKIKVNKLIAENCGNFNPIYCMHGGVKRLVQSNKGDLSDPFRREESYLDSLFITI